MKTSDFQTKNIFGKKQIVCKNAQGEDVKFDIKENEFSKYSDGCDLTTNDGSAILRRVTNLDAALHLAKTDMFYFYSAHTDSCMNCDEVFCSDDDECYDFSMELFFKELIKSFKYHGFVYILIADEYANVDGREIRLAYSNQKLVSADTICYNVKYRPGSKMFYYADGYMKNISASRVSEIQILHSAGCTPTIKYKMEDGKLVPEKLMATEAMAIEWVKSKG